MIAADARRGGNAPAEFEAAVDTSGADAIRGSARYQADAAARARVAEQRAATVNANATKFEILLASANICTAKGAGRKGARGGADGVGLGVTGRMAELEDLFSTLGVAMVAVPSLEKTPQRLIAVLRIWLVMLLRT